METGRQIDLRGLEGARRLMMVAAGAGDDRVREALERRSTVVFMKAIGLEQVLTRPTGGR